MGNNHRSKPLSFEPDEIEAIALGLVSLRDDEVYAEAVETALKKIERAWPETSASVPSVSSTEPFPDADITRAILAGKKLKICYRDRKAADSERVIWPIAIEGGDMLAAWCEVREDSRHFRLDRIMSLEVLPAPIPRRHALLSLEWLHSLRTNDRW